MDKFTFTVEMAKALAWPAVVGIGLWMFGGELVKLLKEVTKIKFGNLEIERQLKAADVELTIAEANAADQAGTVTAMLNTTDESDTVAATAVVVPNLKPIYSFTVLSNPAHAVLTAWENVETTLKFVVNKVGVRVAQPKPGNITVALRRHGYISRNTRGAIELLSNVRASIASGEGTINPNSARGYMDQADRVIDLLKAAMDGPKFKIGEQTSE